MGSRMQMPTVQNLCCTSRVCECSKLILKQSLVTHLIFTPTFLFVHVMCYGGGFKYVVHSNVALSNSVLLLMLHSTELCMGLTHSDSGQETNCRMCQLRLCFHCTKHWFQALLVGTYDIRYLFIARSQLISFIMHLAP